MCNTFNCDWNVSPSQINNPGKKSQLHTATRVASVQPAASMLHSATRVASVHFNFSTIPVTYLRAYKFTIFLKRFFTTSTIPVTYLRFLKRLFFYNFSNDTFLRFLHFLKRLFIYEFLQFLLLFLRMYKFKMFLKQFLLRLLQFIQFLLLIYDSLQTVIFLQFLNRFFFYYFYVTDVGYSFKLSVSLFTTSDICSVIHSLYFPYIHIQVQYQGCGNCH
jgi:hypothetical protein